MRDPARPPRIATALLARVGPAGWTGVSLAADLEDEWRERRVASAYRARAWYWKSVLQVAWAYGWERIRNRGSVAALGAVSARARTGAGLRQDLRYAIRSFRRTPGFTLVAAGTLALGLGAATSVFSVADAVLLRPLPFPEPDRLVQVWATNPQRGDLRMVVSGANYLDWARSARSFSGLAAYRNISFNLTGGDRPERVKGVSITANFFQVLGATAGLGRLPDPEDSEAGAGDVVLSDALWRSTFGADPTILGRSVMVDGEARTVVAVLDPGLDFPEDARLYALSPYRVPLAPLGSMDMSDDRGSGYITVVGRLAEGVSVAAAGAEMQDLASELSRTYGDGNRSASVVGVLDDMVGDLRPTFAVMLGAVGLLLLIACANIANLLAVRASHRQRELAVRMSIGASLGRVRRQLLTESVVLAACGGVLGFFLSLLGTQALVRLAPEGVPRLGAVSVDPSVFGFAVLVTLATGLLFGLAPMVGLGENATSGILRSARTGSGGGRSDLLRDGIVVGEVALSLLLVVAAGLMVRTFRALDAVDPGFDADGVLAANVTLPEAKYEDDAAMVAFYDQALERIRAIPGVEHAGTTLTLPLRWVVRGTFGFFIQGRPREDDDVPVAGYEVVSPGFFAALRIPVLRGRVFEASDRTDAPLVAVVNDVMAQRFWPDGDVMGARVTAWGGPDDPDTEWATVVGVVGSTVKDGLDHPPEPELYIPMSQGVMNASTFVVGADGDPYGLVPELRRAVAEVDPDLPLYGITSMEDVLASSLGRHRFRMLLIAVFGVTALLLSAVGLYGVLSFSVGQRTREIGIRLALGATRDSVVGQVVRQGLGRVSIGIVLGLLASLGARRAIESQVFGVTSSDPLTYLGSACLFTLIAVLACVVPASRAARVDPASSVRAE